MKMTLNKILRLTALGMVSIFIATLCSFDFESDIHADSTVYSTEQLRILDKMEEMGALKAKLKTYAATTEGYEDDKEYLALYNLAQAKRSELISLGAQPSVETLTALDASVSYAPYAWDDDENPPTGLVSLINMLEDGFDMWGISNEINTSTGTYQVYELFIEDAIGGTRLMAEIGDDDYTLDIYPTPYIEWQNVAFESFIDFGVDIFFDLSGLDLVSTITNYTGKTISMITGLSDALSDDATLANAESSRYYITGTANTTMVFVFVRQTNTENWYHAFTTNRVYVNEFHHIKTTDYNLSPNGTIEEHRERTSLEVPDRWAFRLTDAINIYKYDNPHDSYLIDTY